ncbi:MAG: flagellar biosynthesis anti-sigma factor FlgM [Janthinobacterium lividum]
MAQDEREPSSLPHTGEKSDKCLSTHRLLRDVSATSRACLPANRIGQLQAAIAAGTYRIPAESIAEGLLRYAALQRAAQSATASAVFSRHSTDWN